MTSLGFCRADFPILLQKINGKNLAYLDTAASAQKPKVVIDSFQELYETHYANIHRGLYKFSQETTLAYESVRHKVAEFIHAPSERDIVFTRNSTEGINLVASSWGEDHISRGDEIILSGMEHHANLVPWQMLAQRLGALIKYVAVTDDGKLDFGHFMSLLSSKTKIVSLVHISNSLGTINDIRTFIHATEQFNPAIVTLVDGSQSVVHQKVDVQDIGCDFFVFTGHKLYGPNGIGVLYGKTDLLRNMRPYQGGGDMIDTVTLDKSPIFKSAPAKFEAGTPAIAEVIALGKAIDYISSIGHTAIYQHEVDLLTYLLRELKQIDGLTFYGPHDAKHRAGIVSFTADWAHISDIAMILDQCGVAVRTGHHCCMPIMQRFGIEGTIRASLGIYNNNEDIDALINGLKKAKEMLS